MLKRLIFSILILPLISSCQNMKTTEAELLGQFNKDKDLYLANFDLKTDVDDAHAAAAVATMLADERFKGVTFHAVAGTYGVQDGLYVPANDLFEMAFGSHWSDAHTDFKTALSEVSALAITVVDRGGKIWIAEGGQSDFSAALIREIAKRSPNVNLKNVVHIVQHADWNEEVTSPADLAYINEVVSYHRIPDGNGAGNGTPGFRKDDVIDWRKRVSDERLITIWEKAIQIGNVYNAADGRYLNESVMQGGLDFSDASETTWIFGFNDLVDTNDFFREFSTGSER